MLFPIISAVAGLAAGWLIPDASDKLCKLKCKKKHRELPEDTRFKTPLARLILTLENGAVWLIFALFGASIPAALLAMAGAWLAVTVAVIDARIRLIPNETVLVFLALGIALQLVTGGLSALVYAVLCLVGAMLLFLLVAKKIGFWKVGAGDVKYAGAMGLVLGYPCALSGILIMAVSMALFCLGGLALKKLTRSTYLAMAPFMSVGLIIGLVHLIVFGAVMPDLGLY